MANTSNTDTSKDKSKRRVTVPSLLNRKAELLAGRGEKIAALTAYDFTFATLFDQSGIDVLLVGDSLGSVIQGEENTLPVTLDDIVYHTRCVTRACRRALVVADLPFLSYQISIEQAKASAGRLLQEGRASAVKLEGGEHMEETIRSLVEIDIPVMGHIGLTPQSYHRMGGHRLQGKNGADSRVNSTAEKIIRDAQAVERAGAFAIVLEGIPTEVAAEITSLLLIPTIGIGAGPECDGQILVSYDLLGLNLNFKPRFVKRFSETGNEILRATGEYLREVKEGAFPAEEHSVSQSKTAQLAVVRSGTED